MSLLTFEYSLPFHFFPSLCNLLFLSTYYLDEILLSILMPYFSPHLLSSKIKLFPIYLFIFMTWEPRQDREDLERRNGSIGWMYKWEIFWFCWKSDEAYIYIYIYIYIYCISSLEGRRFVWTYNQWALAQINTLQF